jgi:hypothetical protein
MNSTNPTNRGEGLTLRQAALIAGFGYLLGPVTYAEFSIYPKLVIPVSIVYVFVSSSMPHLVARFCSLLGQRDGTASSAPPIESYLPDPVHTFVCRSWELGPLARMAQGLKVDSLSVEKLGLSMSLVRSKEPLELHERHDRLAIMRRNWDYLPIDQLCLLLMIFVKYSDIFGYPCSAVRHGKPSRSET